MEKGSCQLRWENLRIKELRSETKRVKFITVNHIVAFLSIANYTRDIPTSPPPPPTPQAFNRLKATWRQGPYIVHQRSLHMNVNRSRVLVKMQILIQQFSGGACDSGFLKKDPRQCWSWWSQITAGLERVYIFLISINMSRIEFSLYFTHLSIQLYVYVFYFLFLKKCLF